jgi:hypothetical protein
MILDGRNRDRACREAGVKPQYRDIEFGDHAAAIAYVISANIFRRHLTGEQKREIVAKLLLADPTKSDRAIAGKTRKSLEETGLVSMVHTRTDRRGRSQPAHKTARTKSTTSAEPSITVAESITPSSPTEIDKPEIDKPAPVEDVADDIDILLLDPNNDAHARAALELLVCRVKPAGKGLNIKLYGSSRPFDQNDIAALCSQLKELAADLLRIPESLRRPTEECTT